MNRLFNKVSNRTDRALDEIISYTKLIYTIEEKRVLMSEFINLRIPKF
jgi:hypothetical protein